MYNEYNIEYHSQECFNADVYSSTLCTIPRIKHRIIKLLSAINFNVLK